MICDKIWISDFKKETEILLAHVNIEFATFDVSICNSKDSFRFELFSVYSEVAGKEPEYQRNIIFQKVRAESELL